MASQITVENENEVVIPVKKSHSRNSEEKRKEIEIRQARIKARLDDAEKTSSIGVVADVGEAFGKDMSDVYSKASEMMNKYANDTKEHIYDEPAAAVSENPVKDSEAPMAMDPVSTKVIHDLASEVIELRKTVSILTDTVDKLYQIQLANLAESKDMLDKVYVNGKHDTLEVVKPEMPEIPITEESVVTENENGEKVEAVVVPVMKNPYGDISIAVVTGDMITGSSQMDDPNTDGGAKYFSDMYMNILKNKDSKGFLIDILKSRVSNAYKSPVEQIADNVKHQHDMETVALLKLQIEELEKSVLEKKEKTAS